MNIYSIYMGVTVWKQIFSLILLLVIMPSLAVGQTASLRATDGNVYNISISNALSDFSITDPEGVKVRVSIEVASELWAASQVIRTSKTSKTSLDSDINIKLRKSAQNALDMATKLVGAKQIGNIVGLIKGSKPSLLTLVTTALDTTSDMVGVQVDKHRVRASAESIHDFKVNNLVPSIVQYENERKGILQKVSTGTVLSLADIRELSYKEQKINAIYNATSSMIDTLEQYIARKSKVTSYANILVQGQGDAITKDLMAINGSVDPEISKALATFQKIRSSSSASLIMPMSRPNILKEVRSFLPDSHKAIFDEATASIVPTQSTLALIESELFSKKPKVLIRQIAVQIDLVSQRNDPFSATSTDKYDSAIKRYGINNPSHKSVTEIHAENNKERLAKEAQKRSEEKEKKSRDERQQKYVSQMDEAKKKLEEQKQKAEQEAAMLAASADTLSGAKKLRDHWGDEKKTIENNIASYKAKKDSAKKRWQAQIIIKNDYSKKYPLPKHEKWRKIEEQRVRDLYTEYKKYHELWEGNIEQLSVAESEYKDAQNHYSEVKKIHKKRETAALIAQEQKDAAKKALEDIQKANEEAKRIASQADEGLSEGWDDYQDVVKSPVPEPIQVVRCQAMGVCPPAGIDERYKDKLQNTEIVISNPSSSSELYSVPLFMDRVKRVPLRIITERLDPSALVSSFFGEHYSVADWNDLKLAYSSDPAEFTYQWRSGAGSEDQPEFLFDPDVAPYTHTRGGFSVTVNGGFSAGRIYYSGRYFDRQYFVNYHDGLTPGFYLVHDQIGGNEFVVGSWTSTAPFLVVKSGSDPDYSFDRSAGPLAQQTWNGSLVNWSGSSLNLEAMSLTLDPQNKRILGVSVGTAVNAIDSSFRKSSFYYGKNYMGASWGDTQYWNDPNEVFGWAVTTPDSELANYDYTSWGEWQQNTSYNPTTGATTFTQEGSPWIAGQLTAGGDIPTTASATYTGSVSGLVNNGVATQGVSGTASLTADFGNRTLTGSFNNMKLDNNSNWKTLNVNAGWNSGVNSISGSLSGNGATGTVSGNFFGPQATEMGGSWQTTAGPEKAAGIYRAKQQ